MAQIWRSPADSTSFRGTEARKSQVEMSTWTVNMCFCLVCLVWFDFPGTKKDPRPRLGFLPFLGFFPRLIFGAKGTEGPSRNMAVAQKM